MKKKKINRDILILSILTFLTVLTWIGYDVYQALTKYTLPQVLEEQMKPLEATIDRAKIEKLKERLSIPEREMEKIPIPVVIPEIVPEATESATPSTSFKE